MEIAADIYSRMVFPDTLSKVDPHLSDLQKAMLDATPDCIKVVSTDGVLLTMNRAGCHALGVPEDSEFGMPWLPLLPSEVHALGQKALDEAKAGFAARFPGKSISPEGLRYWDNLLTPLVDASGRVLSILCVSRDVTAQTLLEQQLQDAIEREKLVSREMHHRIKNLFAVVSALIALSEREAKLADEPQCATAILRDKVGALARASDAIFPKNQDRLAASDADIDAIVRSVLEPYQAHCTIAGSSASIPRENMTTLALFLHELATNSVKYGALSEDKGHVTVNWSVLRDQVSLTWSEAGGPPIPVSPEHRGFGTEMIDRLVRSAGGSIDRRWRNEGFSAELTLPHSAQI